MAAKSFFLVIFKQPPCYSSGTVEIAFFQGTSKEEVLERAAQKKAAYSLPEPDDEDSRSTKAWKTQSA